MALLILIVLYTSKLSATEVVELELFPVNGLKPPLLIRFAYSSGVNPAKLPDDGPKANSLLLSVVSVQLKTLHYLSISDLALIDTVTPRPPAISTAIKVGVKRQA